MSCFSYTLVLQGSALIRYDDKTTLLERNDMFIFIPGMMIKTLDTSPDYYALCLIIDEATTYETPYTRNVVGASYFPCGIHSVDKILLSDNYAGHHDIAFYADALAVTTINLSRIVKQFSGKTVKNHIDRLLLMEACYMLTCTDEPVSSIADRLRFATPAGFTKFFTRNKGCSPRACRCVHL